MKSKITKGDILLIIGILSLSLFLFVLPFISVDEELSVTVYHEGEAVYEKPLSAFIEAEIVEIGGCKLLMERDGVTFTDSDCEDKLCEKRGKLKLKGDSMACVPKKVVAVIGGNKAADFDGISY